MTPIDRLILSNRKTIALIIEMDGSLTVRAPRHANHKLIGRFIDEKSEWIRIHREKLRNASSPFLRQYQSGELFLFLGETYPLALVDRKQPALELAGGCFLLSEQAHSEAAATFANWYRRRAQDIIIPRLQAFAMLSGDQYRSVRITSAATRWGSCSARNSLNFSWRLVMAPQDVIDYVIVHELVHLKIKNHSPGFWQAVNERMPDFQVRREWLKANTKRFAL